MRVLKLTSGKIFFLQFFLQFLFFSVKCLDGPFLRSNVQVTRPDARGLVTCLGGFYLVLHGASKKLGAAS
jgi:hypothetical protein